MENFKIALVLIAFTTFCVAVDLAWAKLAFDDYSCAFVKCVKTK